MREKSRIRNLSTRFLTFYKYGFLVLLTVLIGWIAFQEFEQYQHGVPHRFYIFL